MKIHENLYIQNGNYPLAHENFPDKKVNVGYQIELWQKRQNKLDKPHFTSKQLILLIKHCSKNERNHETIK